ncbi:MAG: Slp family lipoprotein [Gammaproteobacteria bacterium]|nr:Slp family lipoprotein [Gammaproteobacteria bacterium]MCI0591598.1 Slp family lipoprotein [Gammaproteobacteria bacterium]
MKRSALFVITALSLGGCASQVPIEIREPPADNPTIAAVGSDFQGFNGRYVRWGGTIAAVENRTNETDVEVVAHKLDSEGSPYATDDSLGRFIARVEAFLDPVIYAVDRSVTAYGVLEGSITRPIGEHPYTYPLVKATKFYLWPEYSYYPGYAPYHYGYYDPYYYPYPYFYLYPSYPYSYAYPYRFGYRGLGGRLIGH